MTRLVRSRGLGYIEPKQQPAGVMAARLYIGPTRKMMGYPKLASASGPSGTSVK
jgi:hypothetical protein